MPFSREMYLYRFCIGTRLRNFEEIEYITFGRNKFQHVEEFHIRICFLFFLIKRNNTRAKKIFTSMSTQIAEKKEEKYQRHLLSGNMQVCDVSGRACQI